MRPYSHLLPLLLLVRARNANEDRDECILRGYTSRAHPSKHDRPSTVAGKCRHELRQNTKVLFASAEACLYLSHCVDKKGKGKD